MNDAPPDPTGKVETLGQYIRRARDAAGLSRFDLAGRLGVTESAVTSWEMDRRTPGPRAMHFLAEELTTLDPARLLALAPAPTPADGRGRRT